MAGQSKETKRRDRIGAAVSKMSKEKLEKLRHAFRVDSTIKEACYYAGIHESTYYNWKKANPDLFDEIELERNNPILASRQVIAKRIDENDVHTAKWFLERKRPKEFGPKVGIEHSGQIDSNVPGGATPQMEEIKEEFEQRILDATAQPIEEKPKENKA